jgi:nucleolin
MFRFNNERTIYMEGLPFEATEESITAFFAKVGPLAGLRLPRWHDSGRLRGYGHAEFATADEASRAMKELNGAYHTDVTACVTTS